MKEILIGDKIKKELRSKTSFHDELKSRYGKEVLYGKLISHYPILGSERISFLFAPSTKYYCILLYFLTNTQRTSCIIIH